MQDPESQWNEWEDGQRDEWQEYENSEWTQNDQNTEQQNASQAWQQSQENQQPRQNASEVHPNERPDERRVSWETQDDSQSLLEPAVPGDGTSQLSDISSKEPTRESSWHTQEAVTKPQPLYSPLAGVIKRGSIGGTGERGLNYSMVPPTIDENVPYVGKIGGGKVPVVGLIRRGSISGIGERGYAVSYIGCEDEHKSQSEKGSMGLHDPRLREKDKKEGRHMKKKEPPSFSGSKYSKGGSSYYMSKFGKNHVSSSKNAPTGSGKGHSTVGSTVETSTNIPQEKSVAKSGMEVVNAEGARRRSTLTRITTSRRSTSSGTGSARASIVSHTLSTRRKSSQHSASGSKRSDVSK